MLTSTAIPAEVVTAYRTTKIDMYWRAKTGVVLDYDAAGKLVSLEILDASRRVTEADRVECRAPGVEGSGNYAQNRSSAIMLPTVPTQKRNIQRISRVSS